MVLYLLFAGLRCLVVKIGSCSILLHLNILRTSRRLSSWRYYCHCHFPLWKYRCKDWLIAHKGFQNLDLWRLKAPMWHAMLLCAPGCRIYHFAIHVYGHLQRLHLHLFTAEVAFAESICLSIRWRSAIDVRSDRLEAPLVTIMSKTGWGPNAISLLLYSEALRLTFDSYWSFSFTRITCSCWNRTILSLLCKQESTSSHIQAI